MRDFPAPEALLSAVAAWLRDTAAPNLPPHAAFEAKVAAAAVDLARRAHLDGPVQEEERARLAALLGEDGGLDALTETLSARIRAGEMDLTTPGLADHLWRSTLAKLAVDQPNFAPYRRLAAQDDMERSA